MSALLANLDDNAFKHGRFRYAWASAQTKQAWIVVAVNLPYQFWLHAPWTGLRHALAPPRAPRLQPRIPGLQPWRAPIVFDRLFGTCAEERDDIAIRYGLTQRLDKHNLLRTALRMTPAPERPEVCRIRAAIDLQPRGRAPISTHQHVRLVLERLFRGKNAQSDDVPMIFGRWLKRVGAEPQPRALDGTAAGARDRSGLLDLAKRADRGIFVHLPLWLLIAGASALLRHETLFCVVNAAIFLANVLARLAFRPHFKPLLERDYRLARRIYMTLLLWNCVHWGVLAGAAMHVPALGGVETPLLSAAVGVGCCGALGLAISPFVRVWYPACVLAPIGVAMLTDPTPMHSLFALMSIVLVAYLYRASQVVHDDYWAAADARVELEERARQLELLSITDALTQIHNRLYFEHRLVAEWSRAARERQPLSVLIVDLDQFKKVNDTYGHPFGDRCLTAAAQALRAGLHRGGDVLARYGGEEFAVLLPGADATAAFDVAERLLQCIASVEVTHEGRSTRLACSIGVATIVPAALSSPSSTISQADQALYLAKQQGGNRVVVSPAVSAQIARALDAMKGLS